MVRVREGTFVPSSGLIFMDGQTCAQVCPPHTVFAEEFPGVLCNLLLFYTVLPDYEEGHVARDGFKIQCGWRMIRVNLRI